MTVEPMRSPNRRHDVPSLYKFLTANVGRIVLQSQQLRWSSPMLFNDPFDVPREMDLGWTVDDLNQAICHRFTEYLRDVATPQSPMARLLVGEMRKNLQRMPEDVAIKILGITLSVMAPRAVRHRSELLEAWAEKIPRMRIICFSEIFSSPVMWAHYAEAHSGIVLEFESSDERDSSWLLAGPVVYRSAKPSLPSVERWARAFLSEEAIDWDAYFLEYHYVKDVDWAYEREHRVVSASKDAEAGLFSDYMFHEDDLRGVIVGTNCAAEDETAVCDLVAHRYPNAIVYRATFDNVSRRIGRTPLRSTI